MRKLVFIVAFVLAVSIVSAQTVNVDYPDEVSVGEEFDVSLSLEGFASGVYDIKIDILEGGSRVSRILDDGKWKSTHFYVLEAIDADGEEDFSLTVYEYVGNADVIVKVRSSSGKVETFSDYEIDIVESSGVEKSDEDEEELDEDENSGEEIIIEDNSEDEVKYEAPSVIRLTSQTIKTEDSEESNVGAGETELESGSRYAVYGFIAFFVLIVVLFGLKFGLGKFRKQKNGIA